ncbi:MAG: zinc-ribbon domain-containing protein [Lachnospira eligens]
MFCNKCGTDNPDEAVFCSSCGNNMKQNNNSGRLKLEKVPEDNVTESVTNEDGDSQDTTDSPVTDAKKADATDGVTESLTPDMIPDTFKEKEEKQLAQIVAELRSENKQAVPKKDWYIYSLMSAIPVVGFIFLLSGRKIRMRIRRVLQKPDSQ